MPANPTISEAIKSLRLVEFDYIDGDGNRNHRVVEPYAHGVTKKGNAALRGYQIEGTSETRRPPLWDMFRIDRMKNMRMLDRTFAGDAPDYNPDDPHLDPIWCRVPLHKKSGSV